MTQLVVDRSALLEYLENDNQLLHEVIEIFLADCPAMVAAIQSAVNGCEAQSVMNAAHALKGSVSVFGAENAVCAAQRLESMGRQGNLKGSSEALSVLEREIVLVTSALGEIANTPG